MIFIGRRFFCAARELHRLKRTMGNNMVEIFKNETSPRIVKAGIFSSKPIALNPDLQLVVDEYDEQIKRAPIALNVNWLFYIAAVVATGILLLPHVRLFFYEIGWRWAHILSLSFTLSFCMNPVFARLAKKLNILDTPDARKLHEDATPLLGGAAVFIGFSAALLINGIFSKQLLVILIASLILFGVGILDDFKEVPAGIKLLAQLVCTLLVMSCGIILRVVPAGLGVVTVMANSLLTVFWIIGITNAMNFFDGMDGLAAGLGALISFFLGVVAFQTSQPFLGWIAVAMLGSCLGFLPFNFRVKKDAAIFLGDAGSVVIGFILACVAVYGDWSEANPVVALVSPVLIFWILIFDMVHITVDRILTGKVKNFRQWIEYVGADHLHHRLANVLGGKKQSVLFIYLLAICLGASAVVLRNARPADAILLIIQACIMVVLITVLERRGRRANGSLKLKR
jgi:UDP-GlcNAc:undecaprenyl-phosphate GlcNAc-1-phosphate transferase